MTMIDVDAAGLERVCESIRAGRGVVVVGDPGGGRTYFVQRVVEMLDETARRGLWVGDDVDQLSDDATERLARAVTEKRIVPLVTVSRMRSYSPSLERLRRDGLVERLELTPLAAPEVLDVVQRFLGGTLDPFSVPLFVPRRPGGDLMVLQEVVREARIAGALEERAGVWRLTHPLAPSDGLRRVMHSRVAKWTPVTPIVESVLDVLSLAPEIGPSALQNLLGELGAASDVDPALERLEDDGVIDVLPSKNGLRLRIHDPVIELVLQQTIPLLRRRRLVGALCEALEALPPEDLGGSELVALARSTLELGRRADAVTLNRAALAALQAARAELALQLALASVAHGGGADAQLAAATAEAQLNRHPEALERLELLAGNTSLDTRERDTLEEVSRLVRARLQDPPFGWNLPSHAPLGEGGVQLTSMLRFDILSDGRPIETEQTITTDDFTVAVLEGDRLAQAAGHAAMTGELTRMHDLLDAGEAVLGPVGGDMFRLHLSRAIANCFDGRIDQSLELVLRYRAGAAALGQPVQQSSSGWFAGGLLLAAGRALEAVPVLRDCMDLMEVHGQQQGAALARADLAIALATIGDLTGARAALDALECFPGLFLIEGRRLQARGWMFASEGRFGESASAFARAADAHEALGHSLHSLLALVESARAGGARSVAPRIAELAERVEGESLAVSARFALALALHDTEEASTQMPSARHVDLAGRFDDIGADANRTGMHMVSAEAFDRAATGYAAGGADRAAAAAGRRSAEQVAICGFTALPFLARRPRVELSGREREIASLAAAGLSNRQIAETLVLSVRTVETHLLRVYRKLGVRDRSELEGALVARR